QDIGRRADSFYHAKDFKNAAPTYVWAASLNEFRTSKANSYYNAACSYALAGQKDSAMFYLLMAKELGWNNKTHMLKDTDLESLRDEKQWKKLVKSMKETENWSGDPLKAQLITTDIANFWEAYDLAQKDTAHRLAIYRQYYINRGTAGLHDYFSDKVGDMRFFVRSHDKKEKFYRAIRANTLKIEIQKPQMIAGFVKFKELYPAARFPSIYFVIGAWTSGGTASANGLLIGADQYVKSADIPLDELNMWEKNNFQELENFPHIIAHELIHFNQFNLKSDTTLLSASLREGMCDFYAELMTGKTANERLRLFARGKEKQIWQDFKKEMWINRASNWISNANQETADHPADLGYWVGYIICKAYYNNASDKKQALYDILNIKDYKNFYEKSGVEEMIQNL
ncbi:MAG: TPR end-of-group domain-containing protein, partial [Flavisolibacter sp.]